MAHHTTVFSPLGSASDSTPHGTPHSGHQSAHHAAHHTPYYEVCLNSPNTAPCVSQPCQRRTPLGIPTVAILSRPNTCGASAPCYQHVLCLLARTSASSAPVVPRRTISGASSRMILAQQLARRCSPV
mmetsp:Transcript_95880/g.165271  ORF Transcript_95880/g.165271 Transcript_95880/m.165271 type:complete len:128 (-) Transcript_95880:95-478(-)